MAFFDDVSVIFTPKFKKTRAYKRLSKISLWSFIALCVVFFTFTFWAISTATYLNKFDQQSTTIDELTEKYDKAEAERQVLHNCLVTAGYNVPLYNNSVQDAYANALLLTDAYLYGGKSKAQEVYNGFADQVDKADKYYSAAIEAFKACGISVDASDKSPSSGI